MKKRATLSDLKVRYKDFDNLSCLVWYRNQKKNCFYDKTSEVRDWSNVVKVTIHFKEVHWIYIPSEGWEGRYGANYVLI